MMSRAFLLIEQIIESLIRGIGKLGSFLQLPLLLCVFLIVVLRYFFGEGKVWIQELSLYFHSISFLLATAWALQIGAHVRVDVLYRSLRPRNQALINILGDLFLLWPFCGLLIFEAWPYVMDSWEIREGSSQANGLEAIFLLKSFLIVFPSLMILQSLASLIKNSRKLMAHA